MITSAKQHLYDTGNFWKDGDDVYADYVSPKDLKEFAVKILKYNLLQYRTQMLQFNTGDAGKFKSIEEGTLETIKELENDSNNQTS